MRKTVERERKKKWERKGKRGVRKRWHQNEKDKGREEFNVGENVRKRHIRKEKSSEEMSGRGGV